MKELTKMISQQSTREGRFDEEPKEELNGLSSYLQKKKQESPIRKDHFSGLGQV